MLTHVYILIATTKGGNKSNKKMINIPAEQTWEKKNLRMRRRVLQTDRIMSASRMCGRRDMKVDKYLFIRRCLITTQILQNNDSK